MYGDSLQGYIIIPHSMVMLNLPLIRTVAPISGDVIDRVRSSRRLRHLASGRSLTLLTYNLLIMKHLRLNTIELSIINKNPLLDDRFEVLLVDNYVAIGEYCGPYLLKR